MDVEADALADELCDAEAEGDGELDAYALAVPELVAEEVRVVDDERVAALDALAVGVGPHAGLKPQVYFVTPTKKK